MNALIVSLDQKYAKIIQESLSCENIFCRCGDFKTGLELMSMMNFNMVVFYVPAFHRAFLQECEIIKNRNRSAVYILISDGGPELRIKFNIFDMIFKYPVNFAEFALKIREYLSGKIGNNAYELKAGDFTLNINQRVLIFNTKKLFFKNKEFCLLEYLMINRNRIVTRPEILENVWDYNSNILTNTIDVHISKLRRKLHQINAAERIKTVPCVGYIYECDE